jgi:HAE1 family hydrophobic/amphiphilic exporter-1
VLNAAAHRPRLDPRNRYRFCVLAHAALIGGRIRIGGIQSRSLYQYTLQAPDTSELYRVAPDFEKQVRALPGLIDVTSDLQITNPQLNITLDRDRIAALGLTVDRVESALSTAYGPRQVSTIFEPNNEYQVIMQVAPQFQSDPNAVSMLYVGKPDGGVVPLAEVASIEQGVGPLQVNHTGQLPSVTLSFNLKPGVSLGQAVSEVQEAARRSLPATVSGSFQGAAQAFQDSMRGLGWISSARDLRDLRRARHPL